MSPTVEPPQTPVAATPPAATTTAAPSGPRWAGRADRDIEEAPTVRRRKSAWDPREATDFIDPDPVLPIRKSRPFPTEFTDDVIDEVEPLPVPKPRISIGIGIGIVAVLLVVGIALALALH